MLTVPLYPVQGGTPCTKRETLDNLERKRNSLKRQLKNVEGQIERIKGNV